MTPWGIRKKIKGILGGGGGASTSDEVTATLVLPNGREAEVRGEPRYTLVMASQTLETPIATGCPDGTCGNCNVTVLEGGEHLSTPLAAEQKILDDKWKHKPGTRLACHARLQTSGAKVKVHNVWTMDTTKGD